MPALATPGPVSPAGDVEAGRPAERRRHPPPDGRRGRHRGALRALVLPAAALLAVGPVTGVARAEAPAPSVADGANGTGDGGQRVDGVPVPTSAVTGAVGSDTLTDLFGLPPGVQRYRGDLPVFRASPTDPSIAFDRGFPARAVNTAKTSPSDIEQYQITKGRSYGFRSATADLDTATWFAAGRSRWWCYLLLSAARPDRPST